MVYSKQIELQSREGGKPSYLNITDEVKKTVAESRIKTGICAVISPHTTCSVFFEELAHDMNEDGLESLQQDLENVLGKIIPQHASAETFVYPGEEHYRVVASWPNAEEYLPGGDRSALWNGDAHLKSSLLGSSEVFGVVEQKLDFGSTGSIYFVDFDTTRARTRKCRIVVLGE